MKKSFSAIIHNTVDEYFSSLTKALNQLEKEKIEAVIAEIMKAYKSGKKVFIMGNGGSAANASHMATDLSKGTLSRVYDETESRFKVYSLTDNMPLLTAFANDLDFNEAFLQQLRNLVDKGDVVIALSGSGNSENVVRAVKYAKKCRAITIGILGFNDGGRTGKLVDFSIITQSKSYGICEDIQLILDHIITSSLAKIKREHDRK